MNWFVTFLIFAAGFDIDVFTRYGINYIYIFELDPKEKITHFTLYRIAMLLLFV